MKDQEHCYWYCESFQLISSEKWDIETMLGVDWKATINKLKFKQFDMNNTDQLILILTFWQEAKKITLFNLEEGRITF